MAYSKNTYALPFKKSDKIIAVSDPRAHFANFKHAIDFIMPEGTIILASKAGVVVDKKHNSKKGGAQMKYNDVKYLNYLTLKHGNGEFSQYAHLKYRGVLVKVGDKVKQGQPIAKSGNTGLSTTPHLHFQVFKLLHNGWTTLRPRFKQKIRVDRKQRPVPKSLSKLVKELKKVKKKLKG